MGLMVVDLRSSRQVVTIEASWALYKQKMVVVSSGYRVRIRCWSMEMKVGIEDGSSTVIARDLQASSEAGVAVRLRRRL
ncbi:hypothetical protein C5167_026908 [Papaver somniferum]|nr:hypothetical protein C5167_026908 [Papaver somniferum]